MPESTQDKTFCGDFTVFGTLEHAWDGVDREELVEAIHGAVKKIRTGDPISDLAFSGSHFVVATGLGVMYTWGQGKHYQLGNGYLADVLKPQVMSDLQGLRIVAVAAGPGCSACVSDKGEVYTWGDNRNGQLGHPHEQAFVTTPTLVAALQGIAVRRVHFGAKHGVALTDAGEVYTWGYGGNGRLGHGADESVALPRKVPDLTEVTAVSCGWSHTLVVRKKGELVAFGSGSCGKLGLGSCDDQLTPMQVVIKPVVQVASGLHHSAAVVEGGGVFVWGSNRLGQCGPGYTEPNSLLPHMVKLRDGQKGVKVSCGSTHTSIVTEDGDVFTWGGNARHQLGVHRAKAPKDELVLTAQKQSAAFVQAVLSHTLVVAFKEPEAPRPPTSDALRKLSISARKMSMVRKDSDAGGSDAGSAAASFSLALGNLSNMAGSEGDNESSDGGPHSPNRLDAKLGSVTPRHLKNKSRGLGAKNSPSKSKPVSVTEKSAGGSGGDAGADAGDGGAGGDAGTHPLLAKKFGGAHQHHHHTPKKGGGGGTPNGGAAAGDAPAGADVSAEPASSFLARKLGRGPAVSPSGASASGESDFVEDDAEPDVPDTSEDGIEDDGKEHIKLLNLHGELVLGKPLKVAGDFIDVARDDCQYYWYREKNDQRRLIADANGQEYVPHIDDIGFHVIVKVVPVDGGGVKRASVSARTEWAIVVAPEIEEKIESYARKGGADFDVTGVSGTTETDQVIHLSRQIIKVKRGRATLCKDMYNVNTKIFPTPESEDPLGIVLHVNQKKMLRFRAANERDHMLIILTIRYLTDTHMKRREARSAIKRSMSLDSKMMEELRRKKLETMVGSKGEKSATPEPRMRERLGDDDAGGEGGRPGGGLTNRLARNVAGRRLFRGGNEGES